MTKTKRKIKNYLADFLMYNGFLATFQQYVNFKIQAETEEEAEKQLTQWFAIAKGSLRIIEEKV